MKTRIVIFIFFTVLLSACAGNTSVQNNEIKELLNSQSAVVVDVRTPEEFAEGHIANSINIPLNTLEGSLGTLKEHKNIVVVCRSGNRSAKAKSILEKNGFNNIYDGKGWNSLQQSLGSNK